MREIREIARGRWRALLPQFGVPSTCLVNRGGPCPLCKEGKDRFRFDDKDGEGTWYCNQCGAGDGVRMVMLMRGLEFKDAAREITLAAEGAPFQPPKARRSEDQRRASMNALWRRSRPITADDPAGRYLAGRCGRVTIPHDLRFIAEARYYVKDRFTVHPAMLAMVREPCGKPVNIHRTFLTPEGEKAPYADARKLMEGELPKGAAIRLSDHLDRLGVAEGIETAFSAMAIFGEPCWALVTADNLSAWTPPDTVTGVPIFADHDRSYTGQAAAFTLARRLTAKKIESEVHVPQIVGEDWNDEHRRRLSA